MFQSIQSQHPRKFDTTDQTQILGAETEGQDAQPRPKRTYKKSSQIQTTTDGASAAAATKPEVDEEVKGDDKQPGENKMIRQMSDSEIRVLDKNQVKEVSEVVNSEDF